MCIQHDGFWTRVRSESQQNSAQMLLTQQQHLSHVGRVGSLSKIQSKAPETVGMGKPKGKPL